MWTRKKEDDDYGFPDAVSFDVLFHTIVPRKFPNGETDWRERCECPDCVKERHKLCHDLHKNINKVHDEVDRFYCPQKADKVLTDEHYAKIREEHQTKTEVADAPAPNTDHSSFVTVVPIVAPNGEPIGPDNLLAIVHQMLMGNFMQPEGEPENEE